MTSMGGDDGDVPQLLLCTHNICSRSDRQSTPSHVFAPQIMKNISQLAQSIIRPVVRMLKGNKFGSGSRCASKDRSVAVKK